MIATPISVPGIATRTVPISVSPIDRPEAMWMIAPEIIPPAMAPRSAPTIPAQKRSGTNTVKCHRATATVNQTTAAISVPLRSSMPPVLSAASLLAFAALLSLVALGLCAIALRGSGHRLALRGRLGSVPSVYLCRLGFGVRLLDLGRLGDGTRRRRRRGRGLRLGPHVRQLGHDVVLGEGGKVAHLVDQPLA